ncbi:hypothetical protein ACLBOM_36715 [Escherichia coli]
MNKATYSDADIIDYGVLGNLVNFTLDIRGLPGTNQRPSGQLL